MFLASHGLTCQCIDDSLLNWFLFCCYRPWTSGSSDGRSQTSGGAQNPFLYGGWIGFTILLWGEDQLSMSKYSAYTVHLCIYIYIKWSGVPSQCYPANCFQPVFFQICLKLLLKNVGLLFFVSGRGKPILKVFGEMIATL